MARQRHSRRPSGTPPMNPHQKPQEDVVVTQEDTDATQAFYANCDASMTVDDQELLDRAFARHRLLGHEVGRRDMREAAGKVADKHAADAWGMTEEMAAAMEIATAIRNLPTEPLGGEG